MTKENLFEIPNIEDEQHSESDVAVEGVPLDAKEFDEGEEVDNG